MKILEFISDTNIGGAGVLLLNRLENTDLQKYDTLVVVPRGSALSCRLARIGVPYVQAEVRGDKSFDVGAIREYARIIRQQRPDVVNCHGCLSARIAAKLCRVGVKICTRHCTFPITRKERLLSRVNSSFSDAFVAVAHSVKQDLLAMGVPKQKIHVIINGARQLGRIDQEHKEGVRRELGIGESTTVLGFCARLEKCKGHEWFLGVMRLLSERDVCALLIGDGTQREWLEMLCSQYGLCERVRFCGFVEDVSPLMNIVDIGINCSTGTETSSLALSEGMSLGIVSVVSDYGGNPYMIEHGKNGFVCPQGDCKKMAEYIERLIDDRSLRAQMSKNARARFENELNAASMTQKTNQLYDRLYVARHRAKG